MMDEQWINDAVAEVDRAGMRPGFEAELRSTLDAAWDGEQGLFKVVGLVA